MRRWRGRRGSLNRTHPNQRTRRRTATLTQASSLMPSGYSHSIVAGGLEEMSYTTRLTPGTSLINRLLMAAKTS